MNPKFYHRLISATDINSSRIKITVSAELERATIFPPRQIALDHTDKTEEFR